VTDEEQQVIECMECGRIGLPDNWGNCPACGRSLSPPVQWAPGARRDAVLVLTVLFLMALAACLGSVLFGSLSLGAAAGVIVFTGAFFAFIGAAMLAPHSMIVPIALFTLVITLTIMAAFVAGQS
jgi:uncharacterized paraquat-inducible protein A